MTKFSTHVCTVTDKTLRHFPVYGELVHSYLWYQVPIVEVVTTIRIESFPVIITQDRHSSSTVKIVRRPFVLVVQTLDIVTILQKGWPRLWRVKRSNSDLLSMGPMSRQDNIQGFIKIVGVSLSLLIIQIESRVGCGTVLPKK